MKFPKEATGPLFALQLQHPLDWFGSGSLEEGMQPSAFYYPNMTFLISRHCSSSKVNMEKI